MKRHAQDYSMNLSEFYRRKGQKRRVTSFPTCNSYKGFQAWFLRIFALGASSEDIARSKKLTFLFPS